MPSEEVALSIVTPFSYLSKVDVFFLYKYIYFKINLIKILIFYFIK